MKVPSRPVSFLGLSLATALTLLSFSLTSSSFLSSSSLTSGVYAAPVRSPPSLHHPNALSSPRKHTQQQQQHSPQHKRRSKTPPSNKNQNNKKKNQSKAQDTKKKSASLASSSRTRRHKNKQQQQQLVKTSAEKKGLAPPRSSPRMLSKKSTSPYSSSTPTKRQQQQQQQQQQATILDFDKPLLIIPPPRSVWHAGSVQLVKWSKTYARRLPKDTTVDIILADAKTNKKIVSLKRFIPFRKGSAQVWVPSKIPDNVDASASYVLVLDLFHGKSQQPITVDSAKAAVAAGSPAESVHSTLENHPASTATTTRASTDSSGAITGAGTRVTTPEAITAATGPSSSLKKSLPSILRRSDINIYKRAIPPSSSSTTMTTSSSTKTERENHRIAANAAAAGARADMPPQPYPGHHHNDDYSNDNNNNRETPAFYDFDNYLRQEYPNVIQPIELEHSFGVHQKVYSRAPYTLEWKLPTRAAELLDYTSTRLRLLANKEIDWSQYQHIRDNTITYHAKILVELVRDAGMESVAVLARNVPAETRFQYLQILDHVEPAFYRLKVQMLVVEVDDTLAGRLSRKSVDTGVNGENDEDPLLHGWDFAKGARIIDRYESITRKFWVSAGAL